MRINTLIAAGAIVAVASIAALSPAGVVIGNNAVSFWGNNYTMTTWSVVGDVGSDAFFSPEGATFYNGTLYVSADLGLQSFGRLAAYTPGASGDLSTPTVIQMGRGNDGGFWGPEGLTVNTSGIGYGAFTGNDVRLVSVEASNERAAIINLNQPGVPVTNTVSIPEPDDIAFVSAEWGFAFVEDLTTGAARLRRMDVHMNDTGETWDLPLGVEGIAAVSATFVESLTGVRPVGEISLLMAAEIRDDEDPALPSRLLLTDLEGNLLAPVMEFSIGLDVSIEAIAVDETTGWVYLGDENGRRIHAFQVAIIPAPGAAGVLALGALLGSRRRSRD